MTLDLTAVGICLSLTLALVALAVAIYFGIGRFSSNVVGKLTKIEEHTKHIEKIEEIAVRLDERIKVGGLVQGTVEGTLRNLGKVKVTAEPSGEVTKYYIEVEKGVLDVGLLVKKSRETDLLKKETELFGRETNVISIDSRHIVAVLPSTDAKICTNYISFLLQWLDSTYWNSLGEKDEYEKITFPS